jgi:hypothetical protein
METSNETLNKKIKIKRKGKTQKKINGLSIQSLRNKRVINRYMKYTKKFRPNSLLYTISEHNSNDSTKTFHPKVSQINDKMSFSKKKEKYSMLTLLKEKIKNKTYKNRTK